MPSDHSCTRNSTEICLQGNLIWSSKFSDYISNEHKQCHLWGHCKGEIDSQTPLLPQSHLGLFRIKNDYSIFSESLLKLPASALSFIELFTLLFFSRSVSKIVIFILFHIEFVDFFYCFILFCLLFIIINLK